MEYLKGDLGGIQELALEFKGCALQQDWEHFHTLLVECIWDKHQELEYVEDAYLRKWGDLKTNNWTAILETP